MTVKANIGIMSLDIQHRKLQVFHHHEKQARLMNSNKKFQASNSLKPIQIGQTMKTPLVSPGCGHQL